MSFSMFYVELGVILRLYISCSKRITSSDLLESYRTRSDWSDDMVKILMHC